MPMPDRTTFVVTVAIAASVVWSFLPLHVQSQEAVPAAVSAKPIPPTPPNVPTDRLKPRSVSAPISKDSRAAGTDPNTERPAKPVPTAFRTRQEIKEKFAREVRAWAERFKKEMEEKALRDFDPNVNPLSATTPDIISDPSFARRVEDWAERLGNDVGERVLNELEVELETGTDENPAGLSPSLFEPSLFDETGRNNQRIHVQVDTRGRPSLHKRGDHDFERSTQAVLSTYGKYTDSNRAEFLEKLTSVVSKHFDFKQSARERELKQLEEQLAKLRALHEQRAKEKNEIIRDRVRQLTRETSGLGWSGGRSADDILEDGDHHHSLDIEELNRDGIEELNRDGKK